MSFTLGASDFQLHNTAFTTVIDTIKAEKLVEAKKNVTIDETLIVSGNTTVKTLIGSTITANTGFVGDLSGNADTATSIESTGNFLSGSGTTGQMFYDTTTNKLWIYNGTNWKYSQFI